MAAAALGLLSAAPAIVQGVADTVHMVERLFGKGKGPEKKQAAMQLGGDLLNMYAAAAPVAGLTGSGTSDVNQALSNLIEAIVAFNSAVGIFSHEQKPAQPVSFPKL
jgi:hypothetical protein